MELRVLRYFVEIVNKHGITKAAHSLHISQSTLSRQIQELERQVGTQLLIRGPRQISLTEDGYFLYNRAQEILDLSDDTEKYLREGQSVAGELNVGAGENEANDYLLPAFKKLISNGNNVQINYQSLNGDQIMEGIDRGTLDFGVVSSNESLTQYQTLTLPFEDHWGLAFPAGHSFDQYPSITAADLVGKNLIIPRQLDSSSQLLSYLNEYVDNYQIVATYDMRYNMRALINNGIGLALTFNKPIYQQGIIHFRKLEFLQPIRSTIIWRKDHQQTRLGTIFIDTIKKEILQKRS